MLSAFVQAARMLFHHILVSSVSIFKVVFGFIIFSVLIIFISFYASENNVIYRMVHKKS